jgi:glycerophosphoryl diester phosphodiesterase
MTGTPVTRRIGHKGADAIAPGNTLGSFDAALKAGVDMIEFDVLPANRDGTGELLLAHDYDHIDAAITLEEGLDHLKEIKVDLLVDLKRTGYEDRVVSALRERKLLGRAVVTTMEPASLPILRRLEPTLPIGQSVPKVKRNYLARRGTKLIAGFGVFYLRGTLPRKMARAIHAGRIDAVSAHYSVVTPRFVRAVHLAGGQIYVWTVDNARDITHFAAMDADGVITNDPRLFDGAGGG